MLDKNNPTEAELGAFEGQEVTVFFFGPLTGTVWGKLERVETHHWRGWSVVSGGYAYLKFDPAKVTRMVQYEDGKRFLDVVIKEG